MVSILLILIPTVVLYVCEAQLVTKTSTVGILTTMTETSTNFVLGFCVSQLDGPCPQKEQYNQPYYPSLHEKIFPRDSGDFLYNPTAVEKLEVTLIDPGDGRFSIRNNENYILTQSSLREQNLDHYGSSIEVYPLPTFFFVRPFANLWSSLVRATSTVYETVTSTFLTTSYVQSTTSTSTLFIKKCETSANSEILLKMLPKCQQESSKTLSSSSNIPTTLTNNPTTPKAGNSKTMEKCPGTPEQLIAIDSFCDQKVDCPFATDEIGCSCRSRLDSDRLCDGSFDCPDGEDEADCPECDEAHFTCDTPTCDTTTGKYDAFCNILSPTQNPTEPLLVPRSNSGYVMHNINGKWYPLCADTSQNSIDFDKLALHICEMAIGNSTNGEIKSEIQMINQPQYGGKYAVVNNDPFGHFHLADQCPTSQLLFVSCLDPAVPHCIHKASAIKKAKLIDSKIGMNEVVLNKDSNRIYGGVDAAKGAWPWFVAIIRNGEFRCGGTLVSDRWIVSAAHCFDDEIENSYFEVQVSKLRKASLSPLEQIRPVHSIFFHSKYTNALNGHDIALLTIKEPFQLNQWAAPICLPPPNYRPAPETNCTVVGWGKLNNETNFFVDPLQELSLPLTSCDNLKDKIPEFNLTKIETEKTLICAGIPEGERSTSKGDSGGPLVCPAPDGSGNWIFAGIDSFGPEVCAESGASAAYTRVTLHLDWIYHTMNNADETAAAGKFPATKCPPSGITCKQGFGTCLPERKVCDCVVDCFGAEDEMNCPRDTCPKTPTVI